MPTVHLIFKTHFDFGFTDFAAAVQRQYFEVFIPDVMRTARRLRDEGGPDRLVWTTGSWLIDQYLETGDAGQRRAMEAAIEAGDIVWHGLPFTFHSELADASLFRYGLSLARRLDERFGRRTIAAKMTDVPGHTRAIVPLLAEAGIEFLHIGVNEAATPPDVPPAFVWRAYGADVTVMYQHAYGATAHISGMDDALSFGFTDDNLGPQSAEAIREVFARVRKAFPDAEVKASSLDAFAEALGRHRASLPVLTQEIGDTWIHGAGTDPVKVTRYRALSRLRRSWEAQGEAVPERFSKHLLCVPEHTWGLDEKTHLNDYANYSRLRFDAARASAPFQMMEASWMEQRRYVEDAARALDGTPLAAAARAALDASVPRPVDPEGWSPLPAQPLETAHFGVDFDRASGTLVELVERATGIVWAGPLGRIRYQTFSEADYDRFMDEYLASRPTWGILDNSKPGIGAEGAVSAMTAPSLERARWRRTPAGVEVLVETAAAGDAVERFGCPKRFVLHWTFPDAAPRAELTLTWRDKPACRLPEALWLGFSPTGLDPQGWEMDKMGRRVNPLDVVSKGNRTLHAVDSGLYYRDARSALQLTTLDAPLVTPGEPAMLRFTDRQPDLGAGWHINLFNNLWGTNFPMWFGEDAQFRFVLDVGAGPTT
ncbi:MAG: DUF5054 domain-containing protein [Rhodothermales bacterium]